jgi:hypothetical protein
MLDILIRNWNRRIGDPTVMGWVTVGAYFLAALLLWIQWRQAPMLYREHLRTHRLLLLFFAVSMFALGINKQLDVQTWLTNVGRDISKAQGWWDNRRVAQAIVLAGIIAGGCGLMLVILRAGGVIKAHRLAMFGFLVLVLFVITRASSFFQMDRLINFRILGFRMNWLFELIGIGIIGASAIRALVRRPASD